MAAILAVVLGSSEATADRPPDRVVFQTEAGLFAFHPETGEPRAPVNYDHGGPRGTFVAGNLIWTVALKDAVDDFATEVIVHDGTAIGLRPSGLATSDDGTIRSWTLPNPDEGTSRFPGNPAATEDGRTLFGFRNLPGGNSELWKLDTTRVEPLLLTGFAWRPPVSSRPTTDAPGALYVSGAGRLFFISRDDPTTLLELDANDGHELARIEAGVDPRELSLSSRRLLLGPFLAPDGRHLYLSDDDDRGLNIVDLDAMQVVRELTLPAGMPAPILPLWGRALSPDGTRLYLAGDDPEACQGWAGLDGEPRCYPPPRGVQVIDLKTLAVLYNDPTANLLALSPDGRHLLTSLATSDPESGPSADGLKVIDTDTLEVIARFEGVGAATFPWVSANGRFAYALSFGVEPEAVGGSDGCLADCTAISVYDLGRLELVGTHLYDEVSWATVLP